MSKLVRGALVAIVVLAVGAGVAWGDATIYAGPPNQFFQGDVSIAQGEAITFTNMDTVAHDVTAASKGADRKPLFASAQVGTAQSAPVAGVEYLTAGSYPYICSIHPFMKGTITITSEGTPKPRPGGGGGGGSGQAAATDTTPASVSVKVLDTRRSRVRKRRSLQVAVTTNEPVGVAVTARSGQTVLAQGTAKLNKAGTRKLSIKLTKAGLKAAKSRRPVSLKVTVDSRDASGNTSSTQTTGRLR
jgi:plastocyanin